MVRDAHLTCAFPEGALTTADKLGEIAREYGLAAWTSHREDGEWQIRIEGDPVHLVRFTHDVGLDALGTSSIGQ